ncbi:AcrR family transcriptional regulator [Allocatelliglobosispora scoriae]|uniref:AcrR family transcriptional regulator n=1 Tax=Allocatelliglobosispora scoriae TaxID=643052 RepID=A0A841C2P7_9ACTN|nr:TetR/AcrR family transcriptional regulator C-terminal domain-containing protein [Allocatelliglobosispora scoriae]MBB5873240.1 AcrR family transcriptional regulator [Allocatelliglobosispora scoriae]
MTQIPTPPWRKQRRSTPTRKPLSREQILDAAMGILDAEGLDAMSMRRVADELGTGPASLYAHVANKDDLLELVRERVIGEIPLPVPDPELWREQLHQLAADSVRVLAAHRDIARAWLATVPTGYNALRIAETMLGILLVGGVPPRIAAIAVDRIALYISADAYENALWRGRYEGRAAEEFFAEEIGQITEFYRNLPPGEFPHLTANVDFLTSGDGDERFAFGMQMLIRALETHLPARGSELSAPADPPGPPG